MIRPRTSLEILEDAAALLRSAPLSAIACYLLGAIPFLLGLLFFLSDMMRSPYAFEHAGTASLGLAILYVWKNVWQALFAAQLDGGFPMERPRPSSRLRFVIRLIAIQAALQPVGLMLALPFPWLVAFFRNVALFAARGTPDPVKSARRQATLWTRQNWGVISILTLAGLLLFANIVITIAILPYLARSFLGIEGDFARLGLRILNAGTLSVAAALTWLVIDPLFDAVYAVRCFYGESLVSGEDLLAALRKITAAPVLAMVLFLAVFGGSERMAIAQPAPAVEPSGNLDPGQLDRSMDQVIHRREFTWRAERPADEGDPNRWPGWLRRAKEVFDNAVEWIGKRIRDWFDRRSQPGPAAQGSPVTPRMLEVLIGAAVILIAAIAFSVLRKRAAPVPAKAVTVAASAVDLADESITADQLPEASWLSLADEWLAKGDPRMALRALYLAGLNYLGGRGLVSIRRWKSGLDYRRELERRARALPAVPSVFARNVAIFESGWYGRHSVDRAMVGAFAAGLEEMRKHAEGV
jgi:hypothetical protein